MTTVERSIRLTGFSSTSLSGTSGNNGEILYDQTNKTLRLFDGRTRGGAQLLRADLSNLAGSLGITVSSTPPSTPTSGTQWVNSATGVLYVYYVDTNGGHWIQPVTQAVGSVTPAVTLPLASINTLGAVIPDGSSITVDPDGTISALISHSFTNSNFVGITTTHLPATVVNTVVNPSGFVSLDTQSVGNTFYFITPSSNVTANITSVPTTQNRSTTISIIIAQGNPAYIVNAIQINGVPQTINWVNSVEPAGHIGNTDIMTFNLINSNGTWIVTGSLVSNGA